MKEQEKAQLGAVSVKSFTDQFGEPDEYVTILMQILMEEILNVPPISLLSEPEQEGSQTDDSDFFEEPSERKDQ